jgi:16S rRNA (guanine527-N7)-methyltransferase
MELSLAKNPNSFIPNEQQLELFERYLIEIKEANKIINLVSFKEIDRLNTHIADSLLLYNYLNQAILEKNTKSVLDLGSGGGFPVVPLAITLKEFNFTAIDSSLRKCDFLELIKRKLKLNNLTIIHARIEDQSELHDKFDVVIARALSPLVTLLPLAFPFLKLAGEIFLLKGKAAENEIHDARDYIEKSGLKFIVGDIYQDYSGRDTSVVLGLKKS